MDMNIEFTFLLECVLLQQQLQILSRTVIIKPRETIEIYYGWREKRGDKEWEKEWEKKWQKECDKEWEKEAIKNGRKDAKK